MKAVTNLARFFASHPLTHTAPIKAWQRWLSWQIKSRLRDEVIVPWIGGQLLAVRRGMTGATGNVYAGLHEFADMMFLLHFLRERDLFRDIGANVGTSRLLAQQPVGLPSSNSLYVRDFAFVRNRLAAANKIQVLDRAI
jgi:hypothetical protein